jgi:hypothetical protein
MVLEDSFEIKYNGYSYPIHMRIYKSKEELEQGKPYGEAGLLFFMENILSLISLSLSLIEIHHFQNFLEKFK